MEQLVIYTVGISRAGQLQHFEIPLPRNVDHISGLWYKIRLLDDATHGGIPIALKGRSTYVPPVVVGQISLSSRTQEGVFYYGNLILEKTNVGFLDDTSVIFPAKQYNRSPMKTEPLEVKVDGDTAYVNGFLLDSWGTLAKKNVRYEVDIYLFCDLQLNSN